MDLKLNPCTRTPVLILPSIVPSFPSVTYQLEVLLFITFFVGYFDVDSATCGCCEDHLLQPQQAADVKSFIMHIVVKSDMSNTLIISCLKS